MFNFQKARQGQKCNLKLVVHEGTRYDFTPAMWENVKDWLKAHL